MVYTYACNMHTKNSNTVNTTTITKGKMLIMKKYPPYMYILYVKLDRIFNNICPDNILAIIRIDNEITLKIQEINSINTIIGTKGKGVPLGKNNLKKDHLYSVKPTYCIPKNIIKDKHNIKLK